ncbi:MAG: hypothetical protein WC070_03205 [Candidatus Magasanikbacteria bacterium]
MERGAKGDPIRGDMKKLDVKKDPVSEAVKDVVEKYKDKWPDEVEIVQQQNDPSVITMIVKDSSMTQKRKNEISSTILIEFEKKGFEILDEEDINTPNMVEKSYSWKIEQGISVYEIYTTKLERLKVTLTYFFGDFPQFLKVMKPDKSLDDPWKYITPVPTIKELYSQHPRYPRELYLMMEEYCPEEIRQQNELVYKMNEAIRQKDAKRMDELREEARAFKNSMYEKLKKISEEK